MKVEEPADISPLEKIHTMLKFNNEFDEYFLSKKPPCLRYIPNNKEVIQRLIMKAAYFKGEKDFI